MDVVKRISSTDAPAAKRRQSCAAGGDRWWSTLLHELLVLILQRLPSVHDRIRFGCVCSWWRSVLTEARHLLPPTAPLLLLPHTEDELYPRRQVHGIPSNWVHRILLPDSQYMSDQTQLQEESYRCHHRRKKVICGSSLGWLLVSDRREVRLWNPITKEEIPLPLPPCNFDCRYESCCVGKVVLSSNPSNSSSQLLQDQDCCTVMAICKCSPVLSFCRIRDDSWTTFEEATGFGFQGKFGFKDLICYRGQFYVVTWGGGVLMLDVGPNLKVAVAAHCDWYRPTDDDDDDDTYDVEENRHSCQYYLVESSGDLLRVARLFKRITESTITFDVHKLDFDTNSWSKVVSLGDQALFLGSSSSVSVAAAATDADGYYKRNCIYFLDDSDDYGRCLGRKSDMGVFDLEDGSVTPFGLGAYRCSLLKENCSRSFLYSPDFWIDLAPW